MVKQKKQWKVWDLNLILPATLLLEHWNRNHPFTEHDADAIASPARETHIVCPQKPPCKTQGILSVYCNACSLYWFFILQILQNHLHHKNRSIWSSWYCCLNVSWHWTMINRTSQAVQVQITKLGSIKDLNERTTDEQLPSYQLRTCNRSCSLMSNIARNLKCTKIHVVYKYP